MYDRSCKLSTMSEGATADSPRPARRSRAPGDRARRRVLERAAQLASVEGLEGLSIGRLAAAADMPKSSVYVLFGSKQELQLATIDAARRSLVDEVIGPALTLEDGRVRLLALCEGFLSYVERRVFPGGCFFAATSAEMGARSGPVRDRVAEYQQQWRDLLRDTAGHAHSRGELRSGEDPDQLAFELGALLTGTSIVAVLHDDDSVVDRARQAVRLRLAD